MTKNSTRISSLLGTWTAQTTVKTDIGNNKLQSYIIFHFMSDPMREYSCSLENCNEIRNEICLRPMKVGQQNRCERMENVVSEWSDLVAFVYIGGRLDSGRPINEHVAQSTGDWIGPFSVIMARDQSRFNDTTAVAETFPSSGSRRHSKRVLDRYRTRYVMSPSTPYIRMSPNCTLMGEEQFLDYFGERAVNNTVREQVNDPFASPGDDPYAPYSNTCDNGNVKPILPLVEFTFVQDTESESGESIEVKLNYKVLAAPKKGTKMYNIFPKLHSKGFPISGPYCYKEDPRGGYTIDFSYDSTNEKAYIKLDHSCVEGLPCTPLAASFSSSESEIEIEGKVGETTIELGIVLYLGIAVLILGMSLLVSLFMHFRNWRKKRSFDEVTTHGRYTSVIEPEMEKNESFEPFLSGVNPYFRMELEETDHGSI